MDPNATLTSLLDAIQEGDRQTAIQAARDLADWMAKGGYIPVYTTITENAEYHTHCVLMPDD